MWKSVVALVSPNGGKAAEYLIHTPSNGVDFVNPVAVKALAVNPATSVIAGVAFNDPDTYHLDKKLWVFTIGTDHIPKFWPLQMKDSSWPYIFPTNINDPKARNRLQMAPWPAAFDGKTLVFSHFHLAKGSGEDKYVNVKVSITLDEEKNVAVGQVTPFTHADQEYETSSSISTYTIGRKPHYIPGSTEPFKFVGLHQTTQMSSAAQDKATLVKTDCKIPNIMKEKSGSGIRAHWVRDNDLHSKGRTLVLTEKKQLWAVSLASERNSEKHIKKMSTVLLIQNLSTKSCARVVGVDPELAQLIARSSIAAAYTDPKK
jgi:hypothetical protein